jgi:hypothetical protein
MDLLDASKPSSPSAQSSAPASPTKISKAATAAPKPAHAALSSTSASGLPRGIGNKLFDCYAISIVQALLELNFLTALLVAHEAPPGMSPSYSQLAMI